MNKTVTVEVRARIAWWFPLAMQLMRVCAYLGVRWKDEVIHTVAKHAVTVKVS